MPSISQLLKDLCVYSEGRYSAHRRDMVIYIIVKADNDSWFPICTCEYDSIAKAICHAMNVVDQINS